MRCKCVLAVLVFSLLCGSTAYAEVKDKSVRSIEILNNPSHDSEVGQPPYLEGLTAKVIFVDGEEYIATYKDFTVERYDSQQEGSQLVALRYGTFPTQVALNVQRSVVTRVDVRLTNKTRYIGDRLTKEDFIVTVFYDSGRKQDVNDFSISTGVLTSDTTKVNVQWREYAQELSITALQNVCTELIVKTPGKSEFRTGEDFGTEGLAVMAKYKNGYETEVTKDCEIVGIVTDKEGDFDVRIKYGGHETSYRVRVMDFKFDYADVSEYAESGVVYLYFVNKEDPIPVKNTIWTTDDYQTGKRKYIIHYAGEIYNAEMDIPEDEMKYVGSLRVRAQVPIGINVVTDDFGVLGYVRPTELQNIGESEVVLHVSMLDTPEQLSGVPQSVTLQKNTRTVFPLDIRNEKAYDIATKYFRPFNVVLEVVGG